MCFQGIFYFKIQFLFNRMELYLGTEQKLLLENKFANFITEILFAGCVHQEKLLSCS